MEMLKDTL
jgi:hypothetical protein